MRAVLKGSFTCCELVVLGACFRENPPSLNHLGYFALFGDTDVCERIMTTLRERCRVRAGREAIPSTGIIDSQMIQLMLRRLAKGSEAIREKGRVLQAA